MKWSPRRKKKILEKKNQILVRITLVFFKHSFHPGVDFCWCFNFHFFCFCFVQLLVEDVDFFCLVRDTEDDCFTSLLNFSMKGVA